MHGSPAIILQSQLTSSAFVQFRMTEMIETDVNTSSLAARLRERIKGEGPITFCDWMKVSLYDAKEGYYCRTGRSRWGREGDYRTSPERTPLFAATFARYFAGLYEQLGRPAAWTILEAGAGDGSFAEGILRTLEKSFPNVFRATSYVIDEVKVSRSAIERLQPFAGRVQFCGLDEVEINPGVVFSNELLDAFPVHRIVFDGGEFKEFYVAVDENENFAWLLGPQSAGLERRLDSFFNIVGMQPVKDQVIEVGLEAENWLRSVVRSLRCGYVVTVDYGAAAEDLYS